MANTKQNPKGIQNFYYRIKVLPGSKKEGILERSSESFQISVKEKAERGMANKKSLEILAKHLNIPSKLLRVVKGAKQRNKIIKISNF
ncbi:MAG: DUF167 domain-containing protein [bacterium]|nr:DUF167 domain-containing protein [bacterium]